MTGTSPIRILNDAIKYKNGMRVPISHRNFNICLLTFAISRKAC